jgi:hypothetical protein
MAEEKSDVVIPEAESAEDKFAAERSHKASALAYDLCRRRVDGVDGGRISDGDRLAGED